MPHTKTVFISWSDIRRVFTDILFGPTPHDKFNWARIHLWDGMPVVAITMRKTLYGFSHIYLVGQLEIWGIFFFYLLRSKREQTSWGIKSQNETAEANYYSILLEPWNIFCELTTAEGWVTSILILRQKMHS